MFKRYQLLFFLLLHLGIGSAHAQAPIVPGPAAFSLTRQDTARAIHELFRSRRGGGFGWLAFGGAGMAASIIPAQQTTSAGVWTPGVVIGSTLALLGTKKVIQFGWGRERRVLRNLAATGHLPTDVQRRLHGNFAPLHSTASAPNPLLAYGIGPAAMPAADADTPALISAPGTVATAASAPTLADARQDTLDAVQGLFNAKRLAGQLPILLALPGLRLMTGATNTSAPTSPYIQNQSSDPPAGQIALGLALMTGGVVYMFVHNAPYSDAKFKILRDDYRAGHPLPPALRAQFKPKHIEAGRA